MIWNYEAHKRLRYLKKKLYQEKLKSNYAMLSTIFIYRKNLFIKKYLIKQKIF